ncbi:hypothetical protein K490DRAFT_59853 [Saccharata proteae CBS 121410]|uniref:Uncharacterized protein n=1 Tax=Saccharata proteae CBS 121410 TaxID=1314787 RepID=A0A9P4HRS1_9PEZI|nr:hypothetical protein K490DRAFT_59853 [Saccharata proteae CBS 121410]
MSASTANSHPSTSTANSQVFWNSFNAVGGTPSNQAAPNVSCALDIAALANTQLSSRSAQPRDSLVASTLSGVAGTTSPQVYASAPGKDQDVCIGVAPHPPRTTYTPFEAPFGGIAETSHPT